MPSGAAREAPILPDGALPSVPSRPQRSQRAAPAPPRPLTVAAIVPTDGSLPYMPGRPPRPPRRMLLPPHDGALPHCAIQMASYLSYDADRLSKPSGRSLPQTPCGEECRAPAFLFVSSKEGMRIAAARSQARTATAWLVQPPARDPPCAEDVSLHTLSPQQPRLATPRRDGVGDEVHEGSAAELAFLGVSRRISTDAEPGGHFSPPRVCRRISSGTPPQGQPSARRQTCESSATPGVGAAGHSAATVRTSRCSSATSRHVDSPSGEGLHGAETKPESRCHDRYDKRLEVDRGGKRSSVVEYIDVAERVRLVAKPVRARGAGGEIIKTHEEMLEDKVKSLDSWIKDYVKSFDPKLEEAYESAPLDKYADRQLREQIAAAEEKLSELADTFLKLSASEGDASEDDAAILERIFAAAFTVSNFPGKSAVSRDKLLHDVEVECQRLLQSYANRLSIDYKVAYEEARKESLLEDVRCAKQELAAREKAVEHANSSCSIDASLESESVSEAPWEEPIASSAIVDARRGTVPSNRTGVVVIGDDVQPR
ncbi:hypothetical protein AB1Y20_021204 [Prymnesium parvum]|uniref:Uncharacterized protein n=1 Tax=Prymnesium parvum TaxID=97485 RepID=A0AB34JKV4_PRYPA